MGVPGLRSRHVGWTGDGMMGDWVALELSGNYTINTRDVVGRFSLAWYGFHIFIIIAEQKRPQPLYDSLFLLLAVSLRHL